MSEKEKVTLSVDLVNKILLYLKTCPYEDVFELIARTMEEGTADTINKMEIRKDD